MRVPRNTPPPAANSARFTSGRPNLAWSDATTTSQPSSSSKPPATAVAWAAPTIGTVMSPGMKRPKAAMCSGSTDGVPPSAKLAQVHAGAERPVAGAGEHDGAGVSTASSAATKPMPELADEVGVQRVAGLGPVEAQDEHGAPLLADQDGLVLRHVCSLLGGQGA